jgi:hypothetical protein
MIVSQSSSDSPSIPGPMIPALAKYAIDPAEAVVGEGDELR